jgi:hypothetical protein
MWLVTSLAPLTLSHLVEALKIEYGKSMLNDDLSVMHDADILEICGSLVNFDKETGLVALSHYSVQVSLPQYDTRPDLCAYMAGISHK